jgi:hypothetical protein
MTNPAIQAPTAAAGTQANATRAHTAAFIRALIAAVGILASMGAGITTVTRTPIILAATVTIVVGILAVDIIRVTTHQDDIIATLAPIIVEYMAVITTAIIPATIIAARRTATQARTQAFIRALTAAEFIQVRLSSISPDCAAAMKSIPVVHHIRAIQAYITAAIAAYIAATTPVHIIVVHSRNKVVAPLNEFHSMQVKHPRIPCNLPELAIYQRYV